MDHKRRTILKFVARVYDGAERCYIYQTVHYFIWSKICVLTYVSVKYSFSPVVELEARAVCPTGQFCDVMRVGNGRLGNGRDALLLYLWPGKLSLLIASVSCFHNCRSHGLL